MDRRISTTLGVKAKQLVSISRKDGGRFHTWGATSLPSGSICRYAENAKTASLLFSSASQVSCACPFSKCRQHLKMPSTRLARRLLQHYAPERVLYCPVVSTEFCDHSALSMARAGGRWCNRRELCWSARPAIPTRWSHTSSGSPHRPSANGGSALWSGSRFSQQRMHLVLAHRTGRFER